MAFREDELAREPLSRSRDDCQCSSRDD